MKVNSPSSPLSFSSSGHHLSDSNEYTLQTVVVPAIYFKTQAVNWLIPIFIFCFLILLSTNTDYQLYIFKKETKTVNVFLQPVNLNGSSLSISNNSIKWEVKNLSKTSKREPEFFETEERKQETETISLRFLHGHPRSKRSSSRKDGQYCVLELYRPSKNERMTIHISKIHSLLSPDFQIQINSQDQENDLGTNDDDDGDTFEETLMTDLRHCTYVGEISSHPGGQVALSSCEIGFGLEEFRGFTGLIVLENEHWFIEPGVEEATNLDSENSDSDYPHVMHVPQSSTLTTRTTRENQKRCSSGKLSRPSSGNLIEEEQKFFHNYNEPEKQIKEYGTSELISAQLQAQSMGITIEASAQEHKANPDYNLSSKQGVSKGKGRAGKKPTAASKSDSVVVELAIFADKALYEKMKKKFPKNSVKQIAAYLLAQVNNMNLLYKDSSIGWGNSVDIRLNYLEILTKTVKALNTGKGKESIYLSSFCDFAARKNAKVGFDHAMMLTGLDLRDQDSNGVMGVAWTGAMCDKKYSCSLCEAGSFVGTYTMTHELGHGLGMVHDGEENNLYCSPKDYLMAAFGGPGQVTWSLCSQNNLRDYLNGRSSIRDATNPKCLKTLAKGKTKKTRKPISYKKTKLPGEMFSPKQQCAIFSGKQYNKPILKNTYPYENICRELMCGNSEGISVTTHPALEGTYCGEKKWCKGGKCEAKP